MKIIFSHGKLGSPDSKKMMHLIQIAENLGFDYHSLDYTVTQDPDHRLEILSTYLQQDSYSGSYIMVGSSMGGYVSLLGAKEINAKGCFLLCPALYIKGYDVKKYNIKLNTKIEIVHGWKDLTVLPEMSLRFARKNHCSLHLLDTDHSMLGKLDEIGFLFEIFLKSFKSEQ